MKPSVCVTAFDVCPATPRLPYVHRSSLRGVNEIYPSGFARKQDERKCRCSRPVDTQRPLHGHVRGKVTYSTHQGYDRMEGVVRPITSACWSHSRECLAHSFFSLDNVVFFGCAAGTSHRVVLLCGTNRNEFCPFWRELQSHSCVWSTSVVIRGVAPVP